MPVELSYTYFAERLHARFDLPAHPGVTLELCEVERSAATLPGHDAFTLLFRGPLPALPQSIRTLAGGGQEPLELFLVPVAQVGDAIHYQAIFN